MFGYEYKKLFVSYTNSTPLKTKSHQGGDPPPLTFNGDLKKKKKKNNFLCLQSTDPASESPNTKQRACSLAGVNVGTVTQGQNFTFTHCYYNCTSIILVFAQMTSLLAAQLADK